MGRMAPWNHDREVTVPMRLDKRVALEFGLSRRRASAAVRHGQVDVAGQTCLDPARS